MEKWRRYLIVIGVILILLVVQFRNPDISGPYKGIAGNVLNPFVYLVNRGGATLSTFWTSYIWLVGVEKENKELRKEIDAATLNYDILSEKLIQLENLNNLLGFRDTYSFSTLAANVISRNLTGYMEYILIDRGNDDGVAIGDPVVSAEGLVGRVSDVYKSTSKVVLLYYHNSNVSVINSRTRAVGILKGDGHGGLFVDYYDRLDDAQVGDVLVTSGMGQLFPKGIKVGSITAIDSADTGLFQKVIVDCAADFYKLEQVLIVNHDNSLQEQ